MSVLDKYMITEAKAKSKEYKSFEGRIDKAKSAQEVTKVLKDIKKALKVKMISGEDMMALVDKADKKLEKI